MSISALYNGIISFFDSVGALINNVIGIFSSVIEFIAGLLPKAIQYFGYCYTIAFRAIKAFVAFLAVLPVPVMAVGITIIGLSVLGIVGRILIGGK